MAHLQTTRQTPVNINKNKKIKTRRGMVWGEMVTCRKQGVEPAVCHCQISEMPTVVCLRDYCEKCRKTVHRGFRDVTKNKQREYTFICRTHTMCTCRHIGMHTLTHAYIYIHTCMRHSCTLSYTRSVSKLPSVLLRCWD